MADVLATPGARLTMILGATAVFLGLAVLGRGGFSAFFSHPALVALALATFAMSAAGFFAGGNLSSGVREDRANRWVIVAFAVFGLPFAYLPAWSDRNDIWVIDGDAVRWLGVILFTVGGALRIWPVHVLGNRFSGLVAIHRHLRRHSPPELSRSARLRIGMGPRLSLGGGCAARRPPDPVAPRPHPFGRGVAAGAVRRGV
jgi:hypothetical protein